MKMINNFCTHFDSNYLAYGLNLIDSINKHSVNSMIYTVAMDDECYYELKKINPSNVVVIKRTDIEEAYPRLKEKKSSRSKIEYFFTFSPAICKYILENFKEINRLTYLDSDLYFFASPETIFKEIGDSSIAIIEHNFSAITKSNIKYGRFNVGWISFLRDQDGLKCINDWFENCLDWCYQLVESNRYADQKYLDYWPEKFKSLKIIKNKGANLAPWNISKYRIKKNTDGIFVDDDKLIFYHFANLVQVNNNKFKTNLSRVLVPTSGIVKQDIYIPYIRNLLKHLKKNNHTIIPKKKINHKSFFINILVDISHKVRDMLYNDMIELNLNE